MKQLAGLIAEEIGMEIVYAKPSSNRWLQYDPELCRSYANKAFLAMHDVCHWLVATPRERGWPNFGCGLDPDYGEPYVDESVIPSCMKLSSDMIQQREDEAGIYFTMLCHYAGIEDGRLMFDYESVRNSSGWTREMFDSLVRRGRLTSDGVPVILFDVIESLED
jgi:hypothetical protein